MGNIGVTMTSECGSVTGLLEAAGQGEAVIGQPL